MVVNDSLMFPIYRHNFAVSNKKNSLAEHLNANQLRIDLVHLGVILSLASS